MTTTHAQAPALEGVDSTAFEALSIQAFTSFEVLRSIESEWTALVGELGQSLYATIDWYRVWWRHFGRHRELRVFVIRADDALVGVLPFFLERLWLPFGRTSVAKLVGSDSTVALVEPPLIPELAPDAFALAIRRLLADGEADMVHIGPCSGASIYAAAVQRAATNLTDVARVVRDREHGHHSLFEMPEGFDGYLRTLSKNQRHSYRRNLNKLAKTFEFEVDVVREPADAEREFDAFADMHQAQWLAVGKLGHFGDWPGSRDFSRDLVCTLAPLDGVRILRLLVDGEPVAYHWCLRTNGTYHSRLVGRLTGEKWDAFALGRVNQLKMMEVAGADGGTVIEAGTGRYDYKDRLNAKTIPLRSVTFSGRRPLVGLRARLILAYGDLLDLAYYRAWYLRVAPRVPFLRRPLWRGWIRRRF
jgi:CelD/BcsL family acetyltransferase involved in cellulose biosynthesis